MKTLGFAGLAALVAFLAAPSAGMAQAQDADHFNWHGALARGKTLQITGISGMATRMKQWFKANF